MEIIGQHNKSIKETEAGYSYKISNKCPATYERERTRRK